MELIVTITILGILMAVAIPSIMGYFKKMDMIKANESARQIYTAAQNKLTAMKANGQLDLDEMTSEWALARVPDGSAAAADQTEQIKYYYMNTEKAAAFLSQAGQSLDDELVSTQASIVIELDPVNGYVYGVFFASYSDGDRTLFSYEGSGKRGLQGGTKEFCGSDDLRSQGRARIGYYGGAAAKVEYEASLKTPLMEVVNGEELLIKLSSYGQPAQFAGYLVVLEGEEGAVYERYIAKEQFASDDAGNLLAGSRCILLLDSLAEGHSFLEMLERSFTKKSGETLSPGENITVTATAVSGPDDTGSRSFENREKVNSLFAAKQEEDGIQITVSNVRHLQNLGQIADSRWDKKGSTVRQIQDMDWNNTLAYYNGLAAEGYPREELAENADGDRELKGGNDQAAFTPIPSGKYDFTAYKESGERALKDTTETGYRILNLKIEGNWDAGLFAMFSGSISHVNLVNPKVRGRENVGALAGVYEAQDTNRIINCKVYLEPEAEPGAALFDYRSYTVTGGAASTGGLIGLARKGKIQESFAAINVQGRGGAAGGLSGDMRNVQVEGCYASGQVSGDEETALGGFVGKCTGDTAIERCYTTGELTSVGLTAAGFVGQYEKEAGKINITASYAAVVQRARQDEDGITAVPFVGNGQAEAGKDCFYLGGETSHGAVGLSLDQMTGKAVVRDGKTLDQIYQEGWRYPAHYGTGTSVSESARLTHPYYINGRLTESDTVFPYPALTGAAGELSVPVSHYGDWPPDMAEKADYIQLFYYEKYGDTDYGYYFKDRDYAIGLDATKDILETGYGLMSPEENGGAPAMAGIQGYFNADENQKAGELKFEPIPDFYQVIDGVYYYGMKISGSQMSGTAAEAESWQKTMTASYRTGNPYNYISFVYGEKRFYFSPCFAKALGSQPKEQENPAWFGSAANPFVLRTEAQLKCIDGFGEYASGGSFYYFTQERARITLSPQAWIPLCHNGFMGSYEGNGYTIDGLVIQKESWVTTETNLGLFDTVGRNGSGSTGAGSSIRNLTVETADAGYQKEIRTEQAPDKEDVYFGILAGRCRQSSYIENCNTVLNASIQFVNGNAHSDFTKKYYRTYIGGLVGYSDGTISGCQVWGEGEISAVKNQEVCAGGFAGLLDKNALVKSGSRNIQCLTNTNVRVNGFAAGFAAENKGIIQDAYSGGTVWGSQLYSAGFVVVNHPYAEIKNCSSGTSAEQPITVKQVENNQSGENSSAAGFAAVNAGSITDCDVYAKVITEGTYAAGFVLANCGPVTRCNAVISVKNTNNTAVGFVRENIQIIHTIAGKGNSRSEVFEGKGGVMDCRVYSLYRDREKTNIFGAQKAAGFAGISANQIYNCSVESSIEVEDSKYNTAGAGFMLTNQGYVGSSYSNSIVTVRTADPSRTAEAAGFVYDNQWLIDTSYADCITTAQADRTAKAAGFVLKNGKSEVTSLNNNIESCYALLEVAATAYSPGEEPQSGSVAGFVLTNQKSFGIADSYSAAYLKAKTKLGFGPSGMDLTNCYYLSFGGNQGATGSGTALTEEELHKLSLGSIWGKGTVSTTFPNSPALSGMAYPYPKLAYLDHHGDWPEVVANDGTIFYYEQYGDNSYGIYFMENNYRSYSTLSDKTIRAWGYGVIIEGELNQKGSMTIFARGSSAQSTASINKWVDGKELKITQPLGENYHFYPFKEQQLEGLKGMVENAKVQYLYTKVDSTDTYNFFNPCFAAAINSKSYASVDSANMPDASFGKEGEPFKIRHADHFYYMGLKGYESKESKYNYFEQTHDINLQDQAKTQVWNPWDSRYKGSFGNGQYLPENPYVGDYNGGGYEITGFRLPQSTNAQYVGLFGYIGDGAGKGAVRNVKLKLDAAVDVSLGNSKTAGILSAYVASGSSIKDCSVDTGGNTIRFGNTVAVAGAIAAATEGEISGTGLYGGGVIRAVRSGNAQVKFGGFTAENKGTITDSYVTGVNVEAEANYCYAAGFAAYNSGVITGSRVRSMTVDSRLRTAAGFVMENQGSVSSCQAEGLEVKGKWTASGFVYNNGRDNADTEFDGLTNGAPVLDGDYSQVRIENCTFTGNVTSTLTESCGFVRYNFGTIADSKVLSGRVTYGTWNDGSDNYDDKGASGFCQTNLGTITGQCSTQAEVIGLSRNALAAGFVVNNYGTIRGDAQSLICAEGSVTSSAKSAAGFVVFNTGAVDYAAYTGEKVDASSKGKKGKAAGFAVENGTEKRTSATILHSTAGGKKTLAISGDSDSSGFLVNNRGTVDASQAEGIQITNHGGAGSHAAGFVCYNQKGAVVSRSSAQGEITKWTPGEKGTAGFAASNAGEVNNQCSASVSITTNGPCAGFVGTNEAGGAIRGTSLIPVRVTGTGVKVYSSNESSAGFAWTNKGTIEYARVELGGGSVESGGERSAGFVWQNDKEIRFSETASGTVKSTNTVSGFAGINSGQGVIQECMVNEKADLSKTTVVYGFAVENAGTISRSSVQPELNGQNVYGFAGSNADKGYIVKCTVNSSAVRGELLSCGFAGTNAGEIESAQVVIRGRVEGQEAYGFLKTNEATGEITGAAVTGTVSEGEERSAIHGTQSAAGFAGSNQGTIASGESGTSVDAEVYTEGKRAAGFLFTNEKNGRIEGRAPEKDTDAVFVGFRGASVRDGQGWGSETAGFVLENAGLISYAGVEAGQGASSGENASGFAGKNAGEISHSYVKADTVSAHGNAAGFVSENTKEISKSYAAGEVQGSKESGKAAAGFVLTNTGKVSHSFSVCQVKAQAGSSGGEASGFVWKMTGGSISYSYSASSLVKNGAVRYAFERTEGAGGHIADCYYLDWEGTTGGTASANASPLEASQLEKLSDEGGKLPTDIWQSNYQDQEVSYRYPSIRGLPLPVGELKGSAAFGLFYYEKYKEGYQFYLIDCDGAIRNEQAEQRNMDMPDETGYGIYMPSRAVDQPEVTQNGQKLQKGVLLTEEEGYSYWKLSGNILQTAPLKVTAGEKTAWFYVNAAFAQAIEWTAADENGTVPESQLGRTQQTPLGVRTGAQLGSITAGGLDKYYVQLGDIDLKDQSFEPIGGVEGNAFTGRYDGRGYQITGFAQQRNCSLGNSYLGLFAVNLGELRDVHVEGTINTTKDAENSITAYVGGIAGQNGTGGVISECSADVDIRNANFAGWKNTYVGGLTGLNAGVIEKSYSSGDVENGNYVGGFVGYLEVGSGSNTVEIRDSYCTGKVTKSQGGAPGQFVGKSNWGVIARCYAYNTAAHGSQRIYNMVGSGTVKATDCYYLGEAAKEGAGIKALSSEQMQSRESYAGFDFSGVWTMDAGDNGFVIGYACPQLQGSPQRYEVEAYFAGGGTDPSARDIWEEDVDENKSSGGITEMEVKDDNGKSNSPAQKPTAPTGPSKPQDQPQTDQTEPESGKDTEKQTEPDTEKQSETQTEAQTETQSESRPGKQADSNSQPQSETQAGAKSGIGGGADE